MILNQRISNIDTSLDLLVCDTAPTTTAGAGEKEEVDRLELTCILGKGQNSCVSDQPDAHHWFKPGFHDLQEVPGRRQKLQTFEGGKKLTVKKGKKPLLCRTDPATTGRPEHRYEVSRETNRCDS